MKKRTIATVLWLYAGWTAGSALVWAFSLDDLVAPLVGLAVASIYVAATERGHTRARRQLSSPSTSS